MEYLLKAIKAPIIRENPIAANRVDVKIKIMLAVLANENLGCGRKGRIKNIMPKINTKGFTNVEVSFPDLITFRKIKMTAIRIAAIARNK